jgi:glutamyl-tRNA reductase
MKLLVLGCSYKTASVGLREKLAFEEAEYPAALERLRGLPDLDEGLVLSTCNRVEIWAASERPAHARDGAVQFLARDRQVEQADLDEILFSHADREALVHIFRVTASLDAMVVGETQISSQVKQAYAAASRAGSVGPFLNRCMHRALGAAKRIRTETDIAQHPVSVSSVAADLAGRVFGELHGSTVLVLGAGEMAELAARHLLSDGATDIRVVNRTHERAVSLAFQLGARAFPFDELRGQLLLADIVIASTGSKQPLLTRQLLTEVMRQRKQRPLFVVDIAVPRDVERSAGDLANVYLFDIDDLEQVVAENLKARRKAARKAEAIILQEVDHFEDWLRKQDAVPVIKELRRRFTEVARAEAERTAQMLQLSDEGQRHLLQAMADSIVNKLLHTPTMELKDHAARSDGIFLARSARHLFHLSPAGEGDSEGGQPNHRPQEEEQK